MQIPWWFALIRTHHFSVSIQTFALVSPSQMKSLPYSPPSPPPIIHIKWDNVSKRASESIKHGMNTDIIYYRTHALFQNRLDSHALLLFLSVIQYLWICTRYQKVRVRTTRLNPSPSKTTDYRFWDKANTQEIIRKLHKDQQLYVRIYADPEMFQKRPCNFGVKRTSCKSQCFDELC